ncbi:DegV family protein [uncultured Gemmiger sp.]|uniref:DegV family protein n=1 Tax=uncultured Gemmiger sp. TaxID=1623490 RepID=UPI0025E7A3E8|nr:DegV family protein [uncultured Gemmiger sp.]
MIRILTDSAADLTEKDAAAIPGLCIVPLNVTFEDGETIRDGVDMTRAEFYERLAGEGKLPRTSQPSPDDFIREFEAAKAAGDEVVAILISSKLSGTFQCAQLAAEECEFHDVYFVDTDTASPGEYILIREAVRLREEGISAAEIAAQLDLLKKRIRILAVVDSLKHLHKGGRLPAAVALVGGALGIKPVLSVYEGKVHLADKARGRPGAYVAMFKQLEKMGGIDPDYDHVLVYSSDRLVLNPIQHYVTHILKLPAGHISQIGSVIGTHIGPDAAGIAFVIPPKD